MRRFRTPESFSLQTITEYFELTKPSGTSLLNELLNLGYAKYVTTDKYEVTVKGNALAQVKFIKRINPKYFNVNQNSRYCRIAALIRANF